MSDDATPTNPTPDDSTRRALRTAYQVLLASLVVVPILAATLQDIGGGTLTRIAAILILVSGAVSKAINALEAAGYRLSPIARTAPDTAGGDEGHTRVSLPIWTSLATVVTGALIACALAVTSARANAEPGPVPTPSPSTQSRTWAAPQFHLHLIR